MLAREKIPQGAPAVIDGLETWRRIEASLFHMSLVTLTSTGYATSFRCIPWHEACATWKASLASSIRRRSARLVTL